MSRSRFFSAACRPLMGVLASALLVQSALAVLPSKHKPAQEFDLRQQLPTALAGQIAPSATLVARVKGLQVERHEKTGLVSFVGSPDGFLSGAGGGGISSVSAIPAGDPHRALKLFLNEQSAMFGFGSAALDAARVNRDFVTEHNGLRTTVWQQEISGIPVFEAVLQAHHTANGALVNLTNGFVPNPQAAAAAGTPGYAAAAANPQVSAAAAAAIALSGAGTEASAGDFSITAEPEGAEKKAVYSAPGKTGSAHTQLVWFPATSTSFKLAWQVVFKPTASPITYLALVDAQTGVELKRRSLTSHISDASYNIYTSDSPTPFSPGHPTPLSTQPPEVSRTLVTLSALNTTASPDGWINDGQNETVGNNVAAHTDIDGNDLPDLPRPAGNPSRVFDFTLNLTQQPSTYRNASVVQLFYLNNWIHDRLYSLGFTESAGNFQTSNFGRGGAGNDAVIADAQDASALGVSDNANFSTPPDGIPGRMQMYLFTGPAIARDSSLDTEIVIHEYVHGLSNRLVGGGVLISELQTRGMGEGWSDFYALGLLAESNDDLNGNYAAGGYATKDFYGLGPNYYYGIRRYPYSTNLSKNPLTFKDIDPAQISPHAGVPRSPLFDFDPSEADRVHNQGEVWCSMLWEVRVKLVQKLGFAVGNELALRLVTDGMKLAPANPNFIQARNAILTADTILNGGANHPQIWQGFAKRGLGINATSPASSTTAGVVESFDVPDALSATPAASFTASGVRGGPYNPTSKIYTLTNTGAGNLNWSATLDQPWLTVTPTSGTLAPNVTVDVTVTLNAQANVLPSGQQSATVTFNNTSTGYTQTRAVLLDITPPVFLDFPLDTTPTPAWTTTGQWAFGQPTGGGGPAGSPDPTSGATGNNVYGVNLSGNYSTAPGGPYILQAGPFNLSGQRQTSVQFKRWLNTDRAPAATALFEVSTNGTTWTTLYANSDQAETTESQWTNVRYDIAALADNAPALYLRWSYTVSGTATAYSGWNVDDVQVLAEPALDVSVTLPAAVTEGAASISGTVTLSQPPAADVTVNLSSSDVSELTVPASVVVPMGQTSVNFTATAPDDILLDGTRTVVVTPTAPFHTSQPRVVAVNDSEAAVLSLTLPVTLAEGAAGAQATLTVNQSVSENVEVILSSTPGSQLNLPDRITLATGTSSTSFVITANDDLLIDGTVPTTVTATVTGWTDGSGIISVTDNEQRKLRMSIPAKSREGSGVLVNAQTIFVGASTAVATPLTVNLVSSDPTVVSVPATVVIPAGESQIGFPLTIVDDNIPELTQAAVVTATASTFSDILLQIIVTDNDVHHLSVSRVGSPMFSQHPFVLKVDLYDTEGNILDDYVGSLNFSAAAGGTSLAISPTTSSSIVDGRWADLITIPTNATGAQITVSDGNGHAITTNAFDIITGTPNFLTEQFTAADNDLDFQEFTFLPNSSPNDYSVGRRAIVSVPYPDTSAWNQITFPNDDSSVQITFEQTTAFTPPYTVQLFGKRYKGLHISSNGFVTLTAGDDTFSQSPAAFFSQLRIAPMRRDFDPGASTNTKIAWTQLDDRVVVSWLNLPVFGAPITNDNDFQLELFRDGRIRFSYGYLDVLDGIVGISRGLGVPLNYVETDYTQFGPTAPIISEFNNYTILEGQTISDVPFSVQDFLNSPSQLSVNAVSSNTLVIPNESLPVTLDDPVGGNFTLDITPVSEAFGACTITVNASNSSGQASSKSFNVTITPVNDAPSFTKGGNIDVVEDAGPVSIAGWATAISPGPANEIAQTVTFEVINDNNALFAAQPAVDSNGQLTFRSVANAHGSATVTISARDDGGVANGGINFSPTQTFTITVLPVNDAPAFVVGNNQLPLEDAAPVVVSNWATGITTGASNEAAQTLTFIINNDNPGLFTAQPAVSPLGHLSYTLAPNANGTANVSVVLQDNGPTDNGGSNTSPPSLFTIATTPVNDAPSFTKGSNIFVGEDTGFRSFGGWASNVFAGAPDEAAQTLTFLTTNNNNALFTVQPEIGPDGTLTFTVANGINGSATVSTRLMDNAGTSNGGADISPIQTFTITVSATNDPPVFIGGGNLAVLEDVGLQTVPNWATGISPGDPSEAAQTLTFNVVVSDPTLFAVQPAISATGTLTYRPAANIFGTSSLTVTLVDDGGTDNGGMNTSTPYNFSITIEPVNDQPVIVPGPNFTVLEDSAIVSIPNWLSSVSAGPSNENQSLSYILSGVDFSLFSNFPHVVPETNGFEFRPAANMNGTTTFSLSAMDNQGTLNGGVDTSVVHQVTINITPVNDAPSFSPSGFLSVVEDTGPQTLLWAGSISPGPTDEAAQSVSFELTTPQTAMFSVQPAISPTGVLTYTLAPNASGVAFITVVARDTGGTANGGINASEAAQLQINVSPINDAPSFTKGANFTVPEDSARQVIANWATNISAGPADESAQSLNFNVTTDQPELFLEPPFITADGSLSFQPAANVSGTATMIVSLADNGGTDGGGINQSAQTSFTISIVAVNDAPSFVQGPDFNLIEDADPINFLGWASAITAGAGESNQALFFDVTTNNPALFATQPAISASGTLTYALTPAAHGTATVTVVLRDDGAGTGQIASSSPITFAVNVLSVNDAPTITPGNNVVVGEGSGAHNIAWATNITPGPANESAQTVSIFISNDNSSLFSVQPQLALDGRLTFTIPPGVSGSATVTVNLQDNGGIANNGVDTTGPIRFTILATPINDPPSFTPGANITVLEDTGAHSFPNWATNLSAGPSDEAAQLLTFELLPDHPEYFSAGPAINNDGTLSFTLAPNAAGVAIVAVRLLDSGGTENGGINATAVHSLTITITGVNEAPSFTKGPNVSILEDAGAQTVTGWATDISPGPIDEAAQTVSFSATATNPAIFSVQPQISPDGTLTFTPAADAFGSSQINVILSDSGGTTNGGIPASAAKSFNITIGPVNDAPTFTKGADQFALGGKPAAVDAWAKNLAAGPANESAQTFSFEVTNDRPDLFLGQPSISNNGVLSYTAALNITGTATITARVKDNGGTTNGGSDTSATQSFTIEVVPTANLAASFAGLASPAPAATVAHDNTGYVTVKTTAKAALSGKLTLGGKSYSFKGALAGNGQARFGKTSAASYTITRKGLPSLDLALNVEKTSGDFRITGSVKQAGLPFAEISGERVFYNGKTVLVPLALLNPLTDKGRHTALLPLDPAPNNGLAADRIPAGTGYATFTVSKTGGIKIKGALADGSKISFGGALLTGDILPVYVALYSKAGSVSGTLRLRDIPTISDADATDLRWFRPAVALPKPTTPYPLGWPAGITLDLAGSKFIPPLKGAAQNIMPGLALTANNLALTIGNGGLTADIARDITLDAAGKQTVTPGTEPVAFKLNLTTGLITGKVTALFPPATKAAAKSYSGAIIQKQSLGAGFFVGPLTSGRIELDKK